MLDDYVDKYKKTFNTLEIKEIELSIQADNNLALKEKIE